MRETKSISFSAEVTREVQQQNDGSGRIIPQLSIPNGVQRRLDISEIREARQLILEAFDVDNVPELIAETQNGTRDEYTVGKVTVTQEEVEFEPNENRL